MKLSELNPGQATPLGAGVSGFSLQTQPQAQSMKLSDLSGATSNLAQSQNAVDASRVFQTPLTEIAGGHGNELMEPAKGGIKSGLQEIFSVGAGHAGPVGEGMRQAAPEWAKAMDTFEGSLKPSNTSQAVGAGQMGLAEMFLGGGKGLKMLGEATGLSGFFAGRKAAKELKNTVQAITPKLTSGEMEGANVITPKRGAPYIDMSNDASHVKKAKRVMGIVGGKDKNVDLHAVEDEIGRVAEDQLKPHLAGNKVPFNFEDLQNKMKLTTPPDNLKGTNNLAAKKAWDHAREVMLGHINDFMTRSAKKTGDFTSQTDLNDVWDAFKSSTDKAERELKFDFGTPQYSGTKAAVQQFRADGYQLIEDAMKYPGQLEQVNRAEEFVKHAKGTGIQLDTPQQVKGLLEQLGITTDSEAIAKATFFKDKIAEMRDLYGVRDNLRTWIPDYIRNNDTFAKRNPIKTDVFKYGAGLAGGGAALYGAKKLTED